MSNPTHPQIEGWEAACPAISQGFSAPAHPPPQGLPWGERGSPRAAGDHPKHLSKPVDAQASPTLDGKGSHRIFLSNCKHQDQQKGRGMVSEPALWLFWSNYLISLIDPNIYAFSCCSTNIVRTCDFITSQTETLQDAPDESPKDSASSFSLFLSSNSFSVCSVFR